MADKNKQSSLEATLNAPVFVPGGKASGKASNGKETSQKEKVPPAAAGAGSSKGQAASQAPATAPATAAGGNKAAPAGGKSASAGKLSAAAAAAPVFIPSGEQHQPTAQPVQHDDHDIHPPHTQCTVLEHCSTVASRKPSLFGMPLGSPALSVLYGVAVL